MFFKKLKTCVEEAPMHVLTVWIFNTTILKMSFLLSKNGLCLWISAYLVVELLFFLNVPHLLWIWDFVDMYLTHLRTRKKYCTIHAYSKTLFFWPPKLWCPPLAEGKITYLSTLNFMILQMVKNECVRFCEHVDRHVNYKILRLKVPNNAQNLHNPPCYW
jgi:hypothetical protein